MGDFYNRVRVIHELRVKSKYASTVGVVQMIELAYLTELAYCN